MIYNVSNKKLFKYILLEMLLGFVAFFILIFLIYPVLDVGENRIIDSCCGAIIISFCALFDIPSKKKRSVVKEEKSITYNYYNTKFRNYDDYVKGENISKKYIIYRVDKIKITPMYIKVFGKINAPKNKVEISRIFEKEDEIINDLEKLKL